MRANPGGRPDAVLLVGPTGSGKTPLGEALDGVVRNGRRWIHFDFGAALRDAAAGCADGWIEADDVAFVRRVLETGALLAEGEFGLAERLFRRFRARRGETAGDVVVLNGLPRTMAQARDMERLVVVRLVACLRCTPDVALERIRRDSGGDRAGRADDALESVTRRLRLYEMETHPLVGHYRTAGVRVEDVDVGVDTRTETMRDQLAGRVE